jgi:23S rRNA (adenine2503-C2)-methyltransferase
MIMLKDTLFSQQDKTVNFVFDNNIEARFVRREQKYFIIYLSSHDGCSKACRFCHLTQTKQTSFNEALLEDYIEQAKVVFEYYSKIKILQGKADIVHFNFMSRGEPLSNSLLLTKPENLFFELDKLSKQKTGNEVAFHWTFIKNENDNLDELEYLINYISKYNLNPKFNLVRYNPFSENQGEEVDEITLNNLFSMINNGFKNKNSRIVSRVGNDVYGSCGMFLN